MPGLACSKASGACRGCRACQLAFEGPGRLQGYGGCMCAGRGIACIGNRGERPCELRRSAQASCQMRPAQSMAVGESLNVPSAIGNAAVREAGDQMMQARFGPTVPAPQLGTQDSRRCGTVVTWRPLRPTARPRAASGQRQRSSSCARSSASPQRTDGPA
jgi:hypothetical protein